MKKATKKEVLQMAIEMENKYCDLVWYARKTNKDYETIPAVAENMDRIGDEFPDEVEQICGDNGDWAHGFNSGCLAAFRMIIEMMEYGTEEALEQFPFLDT
jgi:hypothetical protein